MRLETEEAAEKRVDVLLRAAGEERREPVEHDDGQERKDPDLQPDQLRDGEQQTEEDGQPRASEIVLDDEPNRMGRGG